MLADGYILGGRWIISGQIGKGACGVVYSVKPKDFEVDFEVVAKCIPYGKGLVKKAAKEQEKVSLTLNRERDLLAPGKLLQQFQFRPRIPAKHYHGKDEAAGVVYLVMERLDGGDLLAFSKKVPAPSYSDISAIGLQILDGLQWLHVRGWLFVDLKPDNFMFRSDKIVFIDYGLCERFVTYAIGGVKSNEGSNNLRGTPAYVSLAVHKGAAPARRDEIESLAYVLLSLCCQSELPWMNAASDSECRKTKEAFDYIAFARDLGCDELAELITHARALKHDEVPGYDSVCDMLTRLQRRKGPNRGPISSSVSSSSSGQTGMISRKANRVISSSSSAAVSPCAAHALPQTKKTTRKEPPAKASSSPLLPPPASETAGIVVRRSSRGSFEKCSKAGSRIEKDSSSLTAVSHARRVFCLNVLSGPHTGSVYLLGENPALSESCQPVKNGAEGAALKRARLDSVAGNAAGFFQKLIGRSTNQSVADIGLPKDESVSERHLCVLWTWLPTGDIDLSVQDKGSTNGTEVNGVRIKSKSWARIGRGDVIKIGYSELRFDLVQSRDISINNVN